MTELPEIPFWVFVVIRLISLCYAQREVAAHRNS